MNFNTNQSVIQSVFAMTTTTPAVMDAIVISGTMFVVGSFTLLLDYVRRKSGILNVLGLAALSFLLIYDLIPSLHQHGGSFTIAIAMFVAYSIVHAFLHYYDERHHRNRGHRMQRSNSIQILSVGTFLLSITFHCFVSGSVLAISDFLNMGLNWALFFPIFIHKTLEAVAVGTVLVSRVHSVRIQFLLLGFYSASITFGAVLTHEFHGYFSRDTILSLMSVAIGSMAGCLVYDFGLPAIKTLKRVKHSFFN